MQLEPFPYHLDVSERLERAEPDLWQWFRSEPGSARYRDMTQADLRQRAIRLQRSGANEQRYEHAEIARQRIGIDAPVALYRLREAGDARHAFLVFVPGELQIVFSSAMLDRLDHPIDLRAALGREIARFRLYQDHDHRIFIATRLLRWLVRQDGCPQVLVETLRRFNLATEAYCDLGGYAACEDRAAALRAVFKDHPHAEAAATERYLALGAASSDAADDVSSSAVPADLAARARALARSTASPSPGAGGGARAGAGAAAADLASGPIELGTLDLLDQETLLRLTRALAVRLVPASANGASRAAAHARELFPDGAGPKGTDAVAAPARGLASSTVDYFAFLLLDFATVEGTRLRDSIAAAAAAADDLGIGTRFREIARQELRGRRGLQAGLGRRAA